MTWRAPARWLVALAVLPFIAWGVVGGATSARAASSDTFDRFDVVATLDEQGYVNVTETIVLRFGSSSGRHGLERTWITREPDDAEHDLVYRIDRLTVTSPDPVSTAVSTSDSQTDRNGYRRIRVGSSERTISAPTATYVLSYRIEGLMRTSGSYDELYWDITGASMPRIVSATAKITVPGGAEDVFCSVATPGNRGDCASSTISGGVAEFAASDIPPGEVMTVSVKVGAGLVSGNTPIRVENAETETGRQLAWADRKSVV